MLTSNTIHLDSIEFHNDRPRKSELDQILSLISEIQLDNVAQIVDKINLKKMHDKYFFLTGLREIFKEYKELGDTELLLSKGTCSSMCFPDLDAYQFIGNLSNKKFAFVIDSNTDGIQGFHFCSSVKDSMGKIHEMYDEFIFILATIDVEMEIKN